jgi:hypothetical protein
LKSVKKICRISGDLHRYSWHADEYPNSKEWAFMDTNAGKAIIARIEREIVGNCNQN